MTVGAGMGLAVVALAAYQFKKACRAAWIVAMPELAPARPFSDSDCATVMRQVEQSYPELALMRQNSQKESGKCSRNASQCSRQYSSLLLSRKDSSFKPSSKDSSFKLSSKDSSSKLSSMSSSFKHFPYQKSKWRGTSQWHENLNKKEKLY